MFWAIILCLVFWVGVSFLMVPALVKLGAFLVTISLVAIGIFLIGNI